MIRRALLGLLLSLSFAGICSAQQVEGTNGSGGSGPSGFPIIIGSTSIASGSTTTAISGLALTGSTINGLTATANAAGFQLAGGTTPKTLIIDNSLELAGTDSTEMTFPATSATIARTDAAQTFTGTQTFNAAIAANGAAFGVIYGTATRVQSLSDGLLEIIGAGSGNVAFFGAFANGTLQMGAIDNNLSSAIVAQKLRSQGALAGGTSDQAGKNLTVLVSPSKGAAPGGSFIVQTTPAGSSGTTQNAGVNGFVVDSTSTVTLGTSVYTSCAALTTNGSAVVGCTASDPRLKDIDQAPLAVTANSYAKMAAAAISFRGKPGNIENVDTRHQAGFNCWIVRDSGIPLATHQDRRGYCNLDPEAIQAATAVRLQQIAEEDEELRSELSEVKHRLNMPQIAANESILDRIAYAIGW